MKIVNPDLTKQVLTKTEKNGRRNIPKYLYHLTNKKNYEQCLKDGFIKIGHDTAPDTNLNGVFMFDLKNFTKRWLNTGFDIGDTPGENILTLAKALIMKVSSKDSNIVVLRIPTKNLSLDKLRCRIQSMTNISNIPSSHFIDGDLATKQKHFTRKKHAIEYIFENNIPMSNVQKVGETNSGITYKNLLDPILGADMYKTINPQEILAQLFKGQPEEKCIEITKK